MEERKEAVKQEKEEAIELIDGLGGAGEKEYTCDEEDKIRVMKEQILKIVQNQVKSLRPDSLTLRECIQTAEESDAVCKKLSELLQCSICLGRVIDPLDCKKCDKVYCKECLLIHLEKAKNGKCPDCRQSIEVTLKFNRVIKQIYDTIAFNGCSKCSNGDRMTTDQLVNHLKKECRRVLVKCSSKGCLKGVAKRDWEDHLLLECKGRFFECNKCEIQFDRFQFFAHSCQKIQAINDKFGAKADGDISSFQTFVDKQVQLRLSAIKDMQNKGMENQELRGIPIKTEILPQQHQKPQLIDMGQIPAVVGVKRKSKAQTKGISSFAQDGDNYVCLTHAKKMTLVEAIPPPDPDQANRILHIWCDLCHRRIDLIKCNYSNSIHKNLANIQGADSNKKDDQQKKVGEKRKYPFRYRCDECCDDGMDLCLKCINDDKTYHPPQ
ncbi:hypothetical protein FGO68_gene1051 [Halteria grandinella]|uniref:RING-type domain-containing protein n=1 Tax=Halteria grandinella TaxID=5974 RepID=A0A8J8T1G5_HALGN|nr:hypothetical protein FGO68_gene1051 [Halteria grandinella]